jgi:hypothetical protein
MEFASDLRIPALLARFARNVGFWPGYHFAQTGTGHSDRREAVPDFGVVVSGVSALGSLFVRRRTRPSSTTATLTVAGRTIVRVA